MSVAIYLDPPKARALIQRAGWGICADGSFTRPGRTPRSRGGKFGDDFLWALDEVASIVVHEVADGADSW